MVNIGMDDTLNARALGAEMVAASTLPPQHDDIWRPVLEAVAYNKADGARRHSCHRTHMLVCKQWYRLLTGHSSPYHTRGGRVDGAVTLEPAEDSYALYGIDVIRTTTTAHRALTLPPEVDRFRWLLHRQLAWRGISSKYRLAEWFMDEFADCLDWRAISSRQQLSEDFLRRHTGEIDWAGVSEHQRLSESFIESHRHHVCWYWVTRAQVLSEAFIRRYSRYVVWANVLEFQTVSPAFIEWCHLAGHRISVPC